MRITKLHSNFMANLPQRLPTIKGYSERENVVVYGSPLDETHNASVVAFFPGDVQNFRENMLQDKNNKQHQIWCFEETVMKLQKRFPTSHILLIQPSRMDFQIFSRYDNFVRTQTYGIPELQPFHNSLEHLDLIIKNVAEFLAKKTCDKSKKINPNLSGNLHNYKRKIVGFSKGCVVLNQFLYEFHTILTSEHYKNKINLISTITDMYWLDGGHSGDKNTWITDENVLETFSKLGINVHVDVTPYQINDHKRPWIGKEEDKFSNFLKVSGCNIERKVHFEDDPPSISLHFNVITSF